VICGMMDAVGQSVCIPSCNLGSSTIVMFCLCIPSMVHAWRSSCLRTEPRPSAFPAREGKRKGR